MKLVTASWLSFQGALQRVKAWGSRIGNTALRATFWVLGAPLVLMVWWLGIATWYVTMFPLIILVAVPYRLIRRGSRRDKQLMRAIESR